MAQEGITTLPQAPENQASPGQTMSFSEDLSSIKAALANQNPEAIAQYDQGMEAAIQGIDVPIEQLQALLQGLEYILKNEKEYPQIRQQLISGGVANEEDLPEQFDRGYFLTMLVVTQEAINRKQGNGGIGMMGGMDQMGGMPTMPQPPQGFARGGLAGAAEALRQKGRGGDTILAHINPQEARMLKAMGGAGTVNPATGLLEFKGGFNPIKEIGNAFSSVGNAVRDVVSSPVGKILATVALTAALGPVGLNLSLPLAAGLAGGAVSLAGGSDLKTALISGVTSGAMAGLAPGISDMLPGAGGYLNAAATGAIMGAGYGLATGQNLRQAGMSALTGGVLAGGLSAYRGAGATGFGPEGQGGVFSRSTPAPVTDSSAPLTPGEGISTLPTGQTNLTNPQAPTNMPGTFDYTPSGEMVPSNYSPQITGAQPTTTSFGTTTATAAPSPTGAAPSPTGATASPTGAAPTTPQQTPGIGGYFDKAKDYLFSSDPKNPGFFYNDKGQISIPAVTGTVLAGGALMGGFETAPVTPPGIVNPNYTGEDLIAENPSRYLVGGLPGSSTAPTNVPQNVLAPSPIYGAPRSTPYPTYVPPPMYLPPPMYAATGGITRAYPRKNGAINGAGTGTSDDIPAMLSDGEFVLTAKAVRGAGGGSRRNGAKKLYRMMHALEKKVK